MATRNGEVGGLHEHTANAVIADWLRSVGRDWRPSAERKRLFIGSAKRADIVIRQHNREPVVIETEFGSPAVGDAAGRLGLRLHGHTQPIHEVIAVGIDERCEYDETLMLKERLERNELIFSAQIVKGENEQDAKIWPSRPLRTTPFDLIAYCEYAQVPQAVIDEQSKRIAEDIEAAAALLRNILSGTKSRGSAAMLELRRITGSDNADGTLHSICAIWLVAIDLQNDLARHNEHLQQAGLRTADEIREQRGDEVLPPADLLDAWRMIKSVNYEPVMNLAISTLSVPGIDIEIAPVLARLSELSMQVDGLNAKHIYNFAGELWQHLIVDREERAAHYTKPAVAELLASLSAQRFADREAADIARLNLWDAACGTGTLLGAGERALRRLYVQRGGSPDALLHKRRMEHHIFAMDVNSIAGTLTAKRLTDMDVEQTYERSNIVVVDHEAGSLYLLDPEQTSATNLLGQGATATTPGADVQPGQIAIPFGGMDWALMNPPYARARGGRVQLTKGLGPLQRRAANFGKYEETRGYKMANGQAGLATHFGDISNMRLGGGGGGGGEGGGVFAHVLPLTAAHAETWASWRTELETDFEDIVVIANVGQDEESMSADTGMNEILVVATKKPRRPKRWSPARITTVALQHPPQTLEQGYAIAREIASIAGEVSYGTFSHGSYLRTETPRAGFPWLAVGNASTELSLIAMSLVNGKYYDPLNLEETGLALEMTILESQAQIGPTHHLIGHPEGTESIGAFRWKKLNVGQRLPTHISMWEADGDQQRRITARPTHGGTPVRAEKVAGLNEKRSRWFFSRNLDQASQALAIAHTQVPAHGGRAWNALQVSDAAGKAIALFYNSIFGAIVRHAYGQNTQDRRAALQIRATKGIPCPDFLAGSDAARRALRIAEREFNRLGDLEMEPFALCFQDENRQQLDLVVAEMLGLDSKETPVRELLQRYRLLYAREPNVNGRKQAILQALVQYED